MRRARGRSGWGHGPARRAGGSPSAVAGRCRPPGRARHRSRPHEAGAALVLVLVVGLILGLLALSLAFRTALDAVAARNAVEASAAEGQAEGALALGLAELAAGGDGLAVAGELGPWPSAGVLGTARYRVGESAVELEARATVGRSGVTRSVVLRAPIGAAPHVLARP